MNSPLWFFDQKALKNTAGIIGVDEAGRGALAGPVVAAAVSTEISFYQNKSIQEKSFSITDSKQLTASQREHFFTLIQNWSQKNWLQWSWAQAEVEEIERYNILGATRKAMDRAIQSLSSVKKLQDIYIPNKRETLLSQIRKEDKELLPKILIDGRPLKPFAWRHEGIVKGDCRSLVIAMASIMAKVIRDLLMKELEGKYPHYEFARNKGYGTQRHFQFLEEKGPCDVHRLSFLRKGRQWKKETRQTELRF